MGSRGCAPRSRGKTPGGGLGDFVSQKPTTLSVKICYFVTVLRMVIFAFIGYKCSIRNGRKINLEAEKW